MAYKIVQDLGAYAEIGVTHCLGHLVNVENIAPMEVVARDVMPQIAKM